LENRVYIVRSTNKGISGIIDPAGNFKSAADDEYVFGKIGKMGITKSIYIGDTFAYLNALFLVILLWKIKRK
jgi:apolipoprotein N-acyltransferase